MPLTPCHRAPSNSSHSFSQILGSLCQPTDPCPGCFQARKANREDSDEDDSFLVDDDLEESAGPSRSSRGKKGKGKAKAKAKAKSPVDVKPDIKPRLADVSFLPEL